MLPTIQDGRPEAVLDLSAWRRAAPFFCSDFLEHGVVEHRHGQKLLQFGVLVLERLMMPFAMAVRRNSVLPVPGRLKTGCAVGVPDKRQLGWESTIL